jgi:hypothetical protein
MRIGYFANAARMERCAVVRWRPAVDSGPYLLRLEFLGRENEFRASS